MFTLDSFCKHIWDETPVGVSKKIVKSDYKHFEIAKKGGTREIDYLDQNSSLNKLQQDLLVHFLNKQATPVCVKGFMQGESYKSYLSQHVGAKYFLRIDIKSFFPSIQERIIKETFSNMILAPTSEDHIKIVDLIFEIVSLGNSLPQGACTSPMTSNLVMSRLDQRILKYCRTFDVQYTRYADDLLFSSSNFDFSTKIWFIKKVKYILGSQNFVLNYSKTKQGQNEFSLNGYIISKTEIRLSRSRLSDIRHSVAVSKAAHTIRDSLGDSEFLSIINSQQLEHRDLDSYPFNTVFQFTQYLCGYRAFLISWVNEERKTSQFQKELQRLIRRIEKEILDLTK